MGAPKLNHAAIDRTIRRHWSKLRKKGVLAVRPGYAFTGGWITNQPAAVASAEHAASRGGSQVVAEWL